MRKRTDKQTDYLASMILMVMLVIVLAALFWIANTEKSEAAEIELEAGVTWLGNGACVEPDGTEGIATFDGSCMTPADYDAMFSYEALAATPLLINPNVSVADAYGISSATPPASTLRRVFMGVAYPTFVEHVAIVHGRVVL